ncbi:hypothetical protein E2C01_049181 [Portunus trituberculatus]|uniref:Uncharacterized protein n=1 Tax=Portunus trituberculatus TaxID=210409 RepID=A0A5B7GC67_PORTR|nr:hypothetical protein [Portunus trituberculatus]
MKFGNEDVTIALSQGGAAPPQIPPGTPNITLYYVTVATCSPTLKHTHNFPCSQGLRPPTPFPLGH